LAVTTAALGLARQKFLDDAETLTTVEPAGAIVISDGAQAERAEGLYRTGRTLEKNIEACEPYQKVKAQRALCLDAMQAALKPVETMTQRISRALATWKRAEADRVAEEARKRAEAERKQFEAAQKKEAARLAKLAQQTRGAKRKDLLEEAKEVATLEGPSSWVAVQQAVDTMRERDRAAGRSVGTTTWRCELDDVGRLAAHVVASNADLFDLANALRKAIRTGDGTQAVPPDALVGVRREKGELKASPFLNTLAKSLQQNMKVAGARAVSEDGVAARGGWRGDF